MENTFQSKLEITTDRSGHYTQKAIKSHAEKKYDEALDLINKAIVENPDDLNNYHIKADILISGADFENAADCCDKISDDTLKAEALYKWAKVTYFPDNDFEKALDLINRAIGILPESEDSCEFWFLKGEILQSLSMHIEARQCFLKAEGRLEELDDLNSQLDLFKKYSDSILVNITGTNFYNGSNLFSPGKIFDLKKEPDNEHDRDAIAVQCDGQTVGYIANSEYTLIGDVRSASSIKNEIINLKKVEILFIFQNEFIIARLV